MIGKALLVVEIAGAMLAVLALWCLIGLLELRMGLGSWIRSIRTAPGSHWKRGP